MITLVFIFGVLMVLFCFLWINEMVFHERTKNFKKATDVHLERVMDNWWENMNMKSHYRCGLIKIRYSKDHEEAKKLAKEFMDSEPLPF